MPNDQKPKQQNQQQSEQPAPDPQAVVIIGSDPAVDTTLNEFKKALLPEAISLRKKDGGAGRDE